MEERLSPKVLQSVAVGIPQLFTDGEFAIFNDMRVAAPVMIRQSSRPMLVEVGRVLLVTAGNAAMNVNMMPYEVKEGSVLVLPENSYIEVRTMSGDYNARLLSFSRLATSVDECLLLHPDEEDFRRLMSYVDLMWSLVHSDSYAADTRDALLSALLADLRHLAATVERPTAAGSLTARFLELLNSDSVADRSVSAYADRLCVTPNHLSAVVRQQSGQTVMQFVNTRLVLRAKVLLVDTTLSVYEVADRLGFADTAAFSRFFKRETGTTPTEYLTTPMLAGNDRILCH